MLYSEQMKEICDKLGVDRSECKDGLYSTFLQAISDACDNAGGGGVAIKNQDKTITENGTYKADSGYTGLGTVSVNVPSEEPVLQEKTVTENGTVLPDVGYDGMSKVVVDVPGIVPSGTIDITENGSYDVTNFATALVEIAASGGGGLVCGEFTPAADAVQMTVEHNLGQIPNFVVCVCNESYRSATYNNLSISLVNGRIHTTWRSTSSYFTYDTFPTASYPITAQNVGQYHRIHSTTVTNITFGGPASGNISSYGGFLAGKTYRWIMGVI